MYYLRSRPAADPIKFTLDVESLLKEAGNIKIDKKSIKKKKMFEDEFDDKENKTFGDIIKKKVKGEQYKEPEQ